MAIMPIVLHRSQKETWFPTLNFLGNSNEQAQPCIERSDKYLHFADVLFYLNPSSVFCPNINENIIFHFIISTVLFSLLKLTKY